MAETVTLLGVFRVTVPKVMSANMNHGKQNNAQRLSLAEKTEHRILSRTV